MTRQYDPKSRHDTSMVGGARDASLERAFMCLAAATALGIIGWLDAHHVPGLDPIFLVGSLGASAVIVFGTPESPMASPRSVFGGQLVSAVIGVTCFRLLGETPWLSGAVSVALSMFAMHQTRTLHAPGGATALIANIGSDKVHALGYGYVMAPVLSGVVVIMATALVARAMRDATRRVFVAVDRDLSPHGVRRIRVAAESVPPDDSSFVPTEIADR